MGCKQGLAGTALDEGADIIRVGIRVLLLHRRPTKQQALFVGVAARYEFCVPHKDWAYAVYWLSWWSLLRPFLLVSGGLFLVPPFQRGPYTHTIGAPRTLKSTVLVAGTSSTIDLYSS